MVRKIWIIIALLWASATEAQTLQGHRLVAKMETLFTEGEYEKLIERAERWRQVDRPNHPPKWIFTLYKAKAYYAWSAQSTGRAQSRYLQKGVGLIRALQRSNRTGEWRTFDPDFVVESHRTHLSLAQQALTDMDTQAAYQQYRSMAELFGDTTQQFLLLEDPNYIHQYNTSIREDDKEIIPFLFLSYVNELRRTGCDCGGEWMPPAPTVGWSDTLSITGELHSLDMQANDYFDHTGLDGSKPWDRVERQGYQRRRIGENIAQGYESELSVFRGWKASPGHCRNMMRQGYTVIGLGRAGTYWTMLLAD